MIYIYPMRVRVVLLEKDSVTTDFQLFSLAKLNFTSYAQSRKKLADLGRDKLLSAAGSKKIFAISKWRMVSNVRTSRITVSTKNI